MPMSPAACSARTKKCFQHAHAQSTTIRVYMLSERSVQYCSMRSIVVCPRPIEPAFLNVRLAHTSSPIANNYAQQSFGEHERRACTSKRSEDDDDGGLFCVFAASIFDFGPVVRAYYVCAEEVCAQWSVSYTHALTLHRYIGAFTHTPKDSYSRGIV